MRKTFFITVWVLFFLGLASLGGIFYSIFNGYIGYMPNIEQLQNPVNKFASQVFSADGKLLGTWSYSKANRIFVGYDAQLLALTNRAFRLYALSFLIMGFNVYASSFFTALGDGVTSALISFLRTLLFQMAALLLLPALWGIDGVWLAVTAAELAALGVSVYMFVTKDQKFHYRHG